MKHEHSGQLHLANELTIKKNGFWTPSYELMAGQHSYGSLRNEGVWKAKVIIQTTNQTWVISGSKWRNAKIETVEGEPLASITSNIWGGKVKFTAQNGFTASLVRKSVWSGEFAWVADDQTELLTIKPAPFKMPVIKINAQAGENRWLLLLAFLALEFHLTRQRHAVAAAT